ncbi:MAG: TerB family tellurite resistance protein, partial [Pseudomonadota bacterium]
MLAGINQFFNRHMQLGEKGAGQDDSHSTEIAAAALLIEVGRADFNFDAEEEQRVSQYLREVLHLDETELEALLELSRKESEASTSMHEFTRLVHENYTAEQKSHLMEQLWRVALVDGRIDR